MFALACIALFAKARISDARLYNTRLLIYPIAKKILITEESAAHILLYGYWNLAPPSASRSKVALLFSRGPNILFFALSKLPCYNFLL